MSLSAVALPGARVSFITQPRCLELLRSDPSLSFKALQVMAAETLAARNEVLSFMADNMRRGRKKFPSTVRIIESLAKPANQI